MALRYGSENPESAAFVRRSVEPERRSKSSSKKGVIAAVGASVLAGSALLAYQSERSGTTSLRTATTANGAPASNLAANFDVSSYQVPSFLQGDREIVIFPGFKPGLCMDDGGARKTALSAFTDVKCRAESVNQVFVFDEHNLMFRSAKKPNLCLSDGGATKPGDGPAHMAICDPSSPDQRFIYDEGNIQIRNPLKDLCLDDGGATTERETTYRMEKCDPENQNQVFSILWQIEAGGPVDEYHEDEETPAPTEGEPAPTTYSEPEVTEGEPAPTTYSEPAPTEGEPAPTTYSEPEVTEGEPAPTTYSEPAPTEGEPAPTEYAEPSPTEEAGPVTEVIYPEPTEENEPFTLITPNMPGENGAGIPPREYLDQPSEQPHPVDPAHPNPKYTDFTDLDGDWNLLAPSDETIGPVNADSSDDISSEEIYTYLLGIKTKAEKQYEVTMSKYRRTYKCVTAGLQDFAKTSLTADEYHSLVRWMYQHCAFDGPTPGPVPDNEGSSSEQEDEDSSSGSATSAPTTPAVVDRVYMTKLEFYQEIKDHFAVVRDELFGQGEATRLRSEVAAADRKKLLACIEEASTRFGREKEYELPEHFHNAILWVNNECMNTP